VRIAELALTNIHAHNGIKTKPPINLIATITDHSESVLGMAAGWSEIFFEGSVFRIISRSSAAFRAHHSCVCSDNAGSINRTGMKMTFPIMEFCDQSDP
jgi:hypothetical protein